MWIVCLILDVNSVFNIGLDYYLTGIALRLSSDSNREHDVIIYVILDDEFDDDPFIHLGTLRAFDLSFRYRRTQVSLMLHDLNRS